MNLNQVTVPSKNIERAIEFYINLGLKLIVRSLPGYARFVCPDGNATFSVHLVDDLPIGERVYVYFECADLDSTVENLLSKKIEFDLLPKKQSWLWEEARLKDPDGNQIILYFAGENRINPPWRI